MNKILDFVKRRYLEIGICLLIVMLTIVSVILYKNITSILNISNTTDYPTLSYFGMARPDMINKLSLSELKTEQQKSGTYYVYYSDCIKKTQKCTIVEYGGGKVVGILFNYFDDKQMNVGKDAYLSVVEKIAGKDTSFEYIEIENAIYLDNYKGYNIVLEYTDSSLTSIRITKDIITHNAAVSIENNKDSWVKITENNLKTGSVIYYGKGNNKFMSLVAIGTNKTCTKGDLVVAFVENNKKQNLSNISYDSVINSEYYFTLKSYSDDYAKRTLNEHQYCQ